MFIVTSTTSAAHTVYCITFNLKTFNTVLPWGNYFCIEPQGALHGTVISVIALGSKGHKLEIALSLWPIQKGVMQGQKNIPKLTPLKTLQKKFLNISNQEFSDHQNVLQNSITKGLFWPNLVTIYYLCFPVSLHSQDLFSLVDTLLWYNKLFFFIIFEDL